MGKHPVHNHDFDESCTATCPEYKNGPMPGRQINYRHEDGRNCIIGPDGVWRHYDHPVPEPGPGQVVDYKCLRSHPGEQDRMVDMSSEPPAPLLDAMTQAAREFAERGDFGMPGVGIGRIFQVPKCETNIREDGVWYDYGEQGNHVPAQTNQAKRILGTHLPDVIAHFCERNAEYGEEAHVLGTKGQFADINRKVIKLKRYLWDGVPVPPNAEDIPTIAGELIGHLLILIDELENDDA